MDIAQLIFGNLIGILGFAMVAGGVLKIFQAATTLNEIKDLLRDIKRNGSDLAPVPSMYAQSGDEMLRALSDAQEPPVRPEVIR